MVTTMAWKIVDLKLEMNKNDNFLGLPPEEAWEEKKRHRLGPGWAEFQVSVCRSVFSLSRTNVEK